MVDETIDQLLLLDTEGGRAAVLAWVEPRVDSWSAAFYRELARRGWMAAEDLERLSLEEIARGFAATEFPVLELGASEDWTSGERLLPERSPQLSKVEDSALRASAEVCMREYEKLVRIQHVIFGLWAERLATGEEWAVRARAVVAGFGERRRPDVDELRVALDLGDLLGRHHADRALALVEWVGSVRPGGAEGAAAGIIAAKLQLQINRRLSPDDSLEETVGRARSSRWLSRANLVHALVVMEALGAEAAMPFVGRSLDESRRCRDRCTFGKGVHLLGELRRSVGDTEGAQLAYECALSLLQPAGDRSMEGMVSGALGFLLFEQGVPLRARELLENAVGIYREVKNRRGEAAALCNLAVVNEGLGGGNQVTVLLEKALETSREIGDRRGEGSISMNLATNLLQTGDLGRARSLCEEAIKINREVGLRSFEGASIQALAKIELETGAPVRARELLEEAMAIFRDLGDRLSEAHVLGGLAELGASEGGASQGLALLARAHAIYCELGNRNGQSWSMMERARLLMRRGELEGARECLGEALEGFEAIEDPRGAGTCLRHWARLHLEEGDPERAMEAAERSCTSLEQVEDVIGLMEARHVYALALWRGEEWVTAASVFQEAMEAVEMWLRAIGPDLRRAKVLEEALPIFQDAVGFELAAGGRSSTGRAFQVAERAKARSLLELTHARNRDAVIPQQSRDRRTGLELHLRSLQDALLEEKSKREPRSAMVEYLEEEMARVRLKHSRMLEDLAFRFPAYAAEEGLCSPLSLSLVRQRVVATSSVALLEYLVCADETYLWVVRNTEAHVLRLGIGETELCARLRKVLGPLQQSGGQLLRLAPSALRELARLILDQALPLLEGVTRLMIVPSGPLYELPFEMLVLRMPGESGRDPGVGLDRFAAPEYLIDCFETTYGPSATLLDPDLMGARPPLVRDDSVVLVFGDPDYSEDDGSPGGRDRFERLPGTLDEVGLLRTAFPKAQSFTGPEAREAVYRTYAPEANLIHLGCHGVVDLDNPAYTGVVLSRGASSEEDALLQAFEISQIRLKQRPLVVLSACQVASGRLSGAEGLLGLTRAFSQAGATLIIAALWAVEDRRTVTLMGHFYRELGGCPDDPVAAFALARRAMLNDARQNPDLTQLLPSSHPFFWASFRVHGQG